MTTADQTVDPAADIPLRIGDTVQILANHGGCPRCDAGLIAHTVAGGPTLVVPLHLGGAGCADHMTGDRTAADSKE